MLEARQSVKRLGPHERPTREPNPHAPGSPAPSQAPTPGVGRQDRRPEEDAAAAMGRGDPANGTIVDPELANDDAEFVLQRCPIPSSLTPDPETCAAKCRISTPSCVQSTRAHPLIMEAAALPRIRAEETPPQPTGRARAGQMAFRSTTPSALL